MYTIYYCLPVLLPVELTAIGAVATVGAIADVGAAVDTVTGGK